MLMSTIFFLFQTNSQKLPLRLIIVSLGLKSGRTLLERLRKKGWNLKTQFSQVFHILILESKTQMKF